MNKLRRYFCININLYKLLLILIIPVLMIVVFGSKNAEAAIFYQNNFDSEITGTLPTGWSNIGSGTWAVGTTSPVNSTKGLEDPVFHQGVSAVYTGASAITDSAVQISQVVHLDGSNNGAYTGLFLRSSADGQNGYLIAPIFSSNTLLMYKRVSGSFTQVNSATSFGRTFTNNEIALLKAEVSGTTIRWKIWKSTEIEPISWIESVTDSSVSAAGYFGLYQGINGSNNGSSISSVDDLYWGNIGMSVSLIPGTISSIGQTPTTVVLSSEAPIGGISPYTYQWYRSTDSGFTPGLGNILSGQTSLTLSDTGLTPSTNYYYKLRVTDSNSVIVDSSQFAVSSNITAPNASWNVTNDGSGHVAELTNTYPAGTIIGSPSPTTGPNGSGAALSFTNGSAVDLGQNFKFGSGDFTIATWLKTSDAPGVALAAFGEWSGGGDFIWGGAGPAGLKSNVTGSDGLHTVVADGLNDGNWHLVGLIRRGTTLYLSIDGVDYNTASIGSTATINPDNNLFINQLGSGGAGYGGNVDIYELGVWKGVGLPATEMMFKYHNSDTLWTGAPATSYTFTGPTSGTTNSASSNFSVTPNGVYTGTISLTSTGSGTFSPTSLTWNNSSATQTFTYNAPSTSGSPHTISTSSNPSITNTSGTINYSITVGPTMVAVDDTNLMRSPYNWHVSGSSYMLAVNPGAYFKIGFTGTSAAIKVDTSALSGQAKQYPRIRYSIDGGANQDYQLLSGDTQITLISGLTPGTHSLTLWFLSSDLYDSDRWGGVTSLKITGLVLDPGSTTVAPTLLPKRLIAFGDSETEGAAATGNYITTELSNYSNYEDSTTAYVTGVAADLNAEYGQIAFGGQGWDNAFRGVPPLPNSWNYYYSTNSRLVGGLLNPTPDYLLLNMGTNGGVSSGTVVSNWLTSIRATTGATTDIFVIVPFNRTGSANITAGFNSYKTSSGDTKVFLIDLGSDGITYSTSTPTYSHDGLHPNIVGHAQLRTLVSSAINQNLSHTIMASAGSNGSISPNGVISVIGGSNQSFTITANAGYHISDVLIDGVSIGAVTNYSFNNITINHTISALFAIDTRILTYSTGAHGTVTGTLTQTVDYGSSGTSVTAVPNSGYTFTKWSDDVTSNPRTDTNVTADVTVSAIFTAIPSSGGGGSGRSSGGSISYACKDPKATNYNAFGTSNPNLCKYAVIATPTESSKTLGKPGVCTTSQTLTQNLKSGSRNGKYNSYTKAIVKEAKILQAHMNRLGFSSGKEDGILGPISDGAIKRMQTFLGTKADGYVGPLTRALLNNSCGEKGLSN
jgi:hypothetical protein